MSLVGNKGEWSEIYVFLKLLADGKLFAADEQLCRMEEVFFPIIRIIREEEKGTYYTYCSNDEESKVEIYVNGVKKEEITRQDINIQAQKLYETIVQHGKGVFEVKETNDFVNHIFVNKIKAPSADKSDINIQIRDIHTGYDRVVGFSIKSELGSLPTLLNSSNSTNFVYSIEGLNGSDIDEINAISTTSKIKDRVRAIINKGGKLNFKCVERDIFHHNLRMIDSQMPNIVAEMLVGYFSKAATDCVSLAEYVCQKDLSSNSIEYYQYKIKAMLCAVALGMKPASKWDGTDEATGGYIIVKMNGEVLAYHIHNRDSFKNYLFSSTKFDSASSGKFSYGVIYEENGTFCIKLNLQIRFNK